MKYLWILLLACTATAFAQEDYAKKIFIGAHGQKLNYRILYPPQYEATMTINRTALPIKTDFVYAPRMTAPLAATMELMRHLVKQKIVDKDRLYIMGLSMGGMGTLEALSREPKWFAAAVSICGGGNLDLAANFARKVPLWIIHGDADDVVPVDFSRQLYKRLNSLGAKVKYTEYPGVNHNSWDPAFAEPDLQEWMLSQKK